QGGRLPLRGHVAQGDALVFLVGHVLAARHQVAGDAAKMGEQAGALVDHFLGHRRLLLVPPPPPRGEGRRPGAGLRPPPPPAPGPFPAGASNFGRAAWGRRACGSWTQWDSHAALTRPPMVARLGASFVSSGIPPPFTQAAVSAV